MNCKISCSFGEVVDKMTILTIKQEKIKNKKALMNVNLELDSIKNEIPLVNKNDELFTELFKVNKKLWELEDSIREKSKNKSFDNMYVFISELIHKTNDKRYLLKKKINIKYNSLLNEEKEYTTEINELNNKQIKKKIGLNNKNIKKNEIQKDKKDEIQKVKIDKIDKDEIDKIEIQKDDILNLEKGKFLFGVGEYDKSYNIINTLMNKYKDYNIYHTFCIDLLFSYQNILLIFNYENKYFYKIVEIMNNIDKLNINDKLLQYIKKQYSNYNLFSNDYEEAYKYINFFNYIPNLTYNMSFFNKIDKDKILLIYNEGGLGDDIMLSRFIPLLCKKYHNNKIIYYVNSRLKYLFLKIFNNIPNLKIISDNKLIKYFDYHCSLLSLLKYLKIEYSDLKYSDLKFEPLFLNLNIDCNEITKNIIKEIKNNKIENNKKTYILNWKGNSKNTQEKNNRMMELENAIPLFELPNINWIVITKNINDKEKEILNRYNINYYGDVLDNTENSFEDSINVIKNVDGVISTDTSIVHLSANLGIKTFVLLTLGNEWRWSRKGNTNWYPNSILIRQKELKNWKTVVINLIKLI